MPPRRYYFRATDDTVLGPVSLNVVAEMIQAQKLKANTPVSIDGQDFKPMKSLPELATLLSVDFGTEVPEAEDDSAVLETPPTYSGSITEVSLPKLLFHFSASKAKGRLLLTNQAMKKELFLTNGKVVAAGSNLPRDRLGQHLVRNNILTQERLDQILAEVESQDERLGDYLIHKAILSPHELFEHLKTQLLDKIYEVFSWRVGQYAFYEGQEFKGSLLPLNLSPWETITEGVRRGYELNELRDLLLPFKNRLINAQPDPHIHVNQLGLTPRELKVFKQAARQRTLGNILDDHSGDDNAIKLVLSMVYLGLEMDLLTFGEEFSEPSIAGLDFELQNAFDAGALAQGEPATAGKNEDEAHEPDLRPTPPVGRQEQTMLEVLNQLKAQDYFQRLGIDRTAGTAEVSKAFLKAARIYHPDNIPPDAPERIRTLSSEVFALLNEAQQRLASDDGRKQYLDALESGHEDDKVDVSNIVEAEMLFQKGEILLNSRKFTAARDLFEQAIKLNADEGEFHIYRGYAAFFARPDADSTFRNQCIQMILNGLKMRDNSVANGYLFLGRIQKAMGEEENARKNFKKALTIEHNHVEAQRELRLISMREEKKGSFWKLK